MTFLYFCNFKHNILSSVVKLPFLNAITVGHCLGGVPLNDQSTILTFLVNIIETSYCFNLKCEILFLCVMPAVAHFCSQVLVFLLFFHVNDYLSALLDPEVTVLQLMHHRITRNIFYMLQFYRI